MLRYVTCSVGKYQEIKKLASSTSFIQSESISFFSDSKNLQPKILVLVREDSV